MVTEHVIIPATVTLESSSMSSSDVEKEAQYPHEVDDEASAVSDGVDVLNLPFRTLTAEARMGEYTTEIAAGL